MFILKFWGKQLFGAGRSGQWPRVRKEYLKEHPECEATGSREKLEVHHVVPYSVDPSLELEFSNLITLTRKNGIHLIVGHLGSFQSYNDKVREDAKTLLEKILHRPCII
jgi:hypothetical protein